jgi:hypothetical protein
VERTLVVVPTESLGGTDRIEDVSQPASALRELLGAHSARFGDELIGCERPHLCHGIDIHPVTRYRITEPSPDGIGLRGGEFALEQRPSQRRVPRRLRRRLDGGGVRPQRILSAFEQRTADTYVPGRIRAGSTRDRLDQRRGGRMPVHGGESRVAVFAPRLLCSDPGEHGLHESGVVDECSDLGQEQHDRLTAEPRRRRGQPARSTLSSSNAASRWMCSFITSRIVMHEVSHRPPTFERKIQSWCTTRSEPRTGEETSGCRTRLSDCSHRAHPRRPPT